MINELSWWLLLLLLAVEPWLTNKNVIFGVAFSQGEFWQKPFPRRLRRWYLLVLLGGGLLFNLLLLNSSQKTTWLLLGMPLLLGLSLLTFGIFHHKILNWQLQQKTDLQLTKQCLSVDTQQLSENELSAWWLVTLLILPFTAVISASFNYADLPAKLPVHFSFNGPDAWINKSQGGVWKVLVMQFGITLIFILLTWLMRRSPAAVRGNSQAVPGFYRFRRSIYFLLIFAGLLSQVTLSTPFLTQQNQLVFWLNRLNLIFVLILVIMPLLFYCFFTLRHEPHGPILNDNSKWLLGLIYYDPHDPSIFVQKRSGLGFTLNMARPASWVILGGIFVFAIIAAWLQN